MAVLLPVAPVHSFRATDAVGLHCSNQNTLAISAADVFH